MINNILKSVRNMVSITLLPLALAGCGTAGGGLALESAGLAPVAIKPGDSAPRITMSIPTKAQSVEKTVQKSTPETALVKSVRDEEAEKIVKALEVASLKEKSRAGHSLVKTAKKSGRDARKRRTIAKKPLIKKTVAKKVSVKKAAAAARGTKSRPVKAAALRPVIRKPVAKKAVVNRISVKKEIARKDAARKKEVVRKVVAQLPRSAPKTPDIKGATADAVSETPPRVAMVPPQVIPVQLVPQNVPRDISEAFDEQPVAKKSTPETDKLAKAGPSRTFGGFGEADHRFAGR